MRQTAIEMALSTREPERSRLEVLFSSACRE